MNHMAAKARARKQRAQNVLLGCLQGVAFPWPGADGLTIDEVLGSYPQAMAAGLVPRQEALVLSHPDLIEELETFFGGTVR